MIGIPYSTSPSFEEIAYSVPPYTPFPVFWPEDGLAGPIVARIVAPARIRAGERTSLVVDVERYDTDGTATEWGDIELSVSICRTGQVPLLTPVDPLIPEWNGVELDVYQEYVGSRKHYRFRYTIVDGSVPGAVTLEAGREYGVWLLYLIGDVQFTDMIGAIVVDG